MRVVWITTLLMVTIDSVYSHSFLLEPPTEAKLTGMRECRIGGPREGNTNNCHGPCISNSWQLRQNIPTTTYKRGQVVTMVWARNNHEGGFVRFALVPIKDRMNKAVHDKFAFHYACYNAGLHNCPANKSREYCGTERRLHRTTVKIPNTYPDGKYILGWSWFGGILNEAAWFGDYWSCSHVEIKGGSFEDSFTPTFSPGMAGDRCYSAVNRLGICSKEPCQNGNSFKATEMVPAGFIKTKDGKFVSTSEIHLFDLNPRYEDIPPTVTASSLVSPSPSVVVVPSLPSRPRLTPASRPKPTVSASPSASTTASPTSSMAPTLSPTLTPSWTLIPSVPPTPSTPKSTRKPTRQSGKTRAEILQLKLLDISHGIKTVAVDFKKPINLGRYERITLEVKTRGDFGKVEFFIDGVHVWTELKVPYIISGNIGRHYNRWIPPMDRWIRITIKGYTRTGNHLVFKTFGAKFVQSVSKHIT